MSSKPFVRYLVALAMLALALGIRWGMQGWLGAAAAAHPTVLVAVILAAWYCGAGPAVLIAGLGYLAVELMLLAHTPEAWDVRYLLASVAFYYALAGVMIFFLARVRSERDKLQRTQASLKDSEHRLRASFDNAALGITEADAQGRLVAVNERMCAITGYSRAELLGMRVRDLTAPEDLAESDRQSARLREGVVDRLDYEKRYARRDGSRVWVNVSASSIRDEAGRFLYAIGIVQNIEERKKAEESVTLLSQAIASAANSIVLTDRKGRILWVNPAFTQMTGYALDELVGRTPALLKSGRQPTEFYQKLWSTILGGSVWHGHLVNQRKDGSLYDEEMTITPVRALGSEVTHFVGIKQDITERRRAEELLQAARVSAERAKAAAEEANQAKDRFLAVLSHELRTPLTPVLAAVQLLQRTRGTSEELRQPLEIICRNIQLEARLIDDLLDITRIIQGKLVLERKPIDITTVVQRAAEISMPDIIAKRLVFSAETGGGPFLVNGDISRLQQVVWNVLSNAVKFTPAGGAVAVRCRRENGRVTVEVGDTGIGIEPARISEIFDAFEQGDPGITRQFGGLGLGLAIAKRLVEMHEGAISAHSEGKDRGVTVRVSLPLVNAELGAQPEPPPLLTRGRSRILLVEDNADTATTMTMLLEAFGYRVASAPDATQALAAIESQRFDLVISDLGLPDRSGIELMQEIRRRCNPLRGIALSGYGFEEDVQRSTEAGFSAHLTKPVDVDALVQAVAATLEGEPCTGDPRPSIVAVAMVRQGGVAPVGRA